MYMGEKMIRKQIYITGEEEHGLRQLSYLKQKPQADIVREALDQYLARDAEKTARRTKRSRAKRSVETTCPLERIIGLADDLDGPDDLSSRHDYYLYAGDDD
jgi:hypothetical protein